MMNNFLLDIGYLFIFITFVIGMLLLLGSILWDDDTAVDEAYKWQIPKQIISLYLRKGDTHTTIMERVGKIRHYLRKLLKFSKIFSTLSLFFLIFSLSIKYLGMRFIDYRILKTCFLFLLGLSLFFTAVDYFNETICKKLEELYDSKEK